MTLNEIEDKIASNELNAAQVFTQMKQHIPNDDVAYFFSAEYVLDGVARFICGTLKTPLHMLGSEVLDEVKLEIPIGAENVKFVSFNRC